MWLTAKVISSPSPVAWRRSKIAPALLISTSMWLSLRVTASAAAIIAAMVDRSACTQSWAASGLARTSRLSISRPLAASRATNTTRAPCRARSSAAICPMPDVAPVITTVLPCMDEVRRERGNRPEHRPGRAGRQSQTRPVQHEISVVDRAPGSPAAGDGVAVDGDAARRGQEGDDVGHLGGVDDAADGDV